MPSPGLLIGARAVQGLAAAFVVPLTLAMIAAEFPEGKPRNIALTAWGTITAISASLGLVAGGLLVTGPGWRWIFYVNLPVGALILYESWRYLRDDAAMAFSTVHHWQDPIAGLREMRRVARRVVVFTFDASDTGWRRRFWLPLLRWPIASGRETCSMTVHGVTSVFAGFRFPPEVISIAVRWYLRYGLSYRDVEELLAERGITVDHVTVYRWVQRFTPEFIEAARLCRHAPGDRWFVDETYVKVAGRWTYLYRAIDQHGQVIDVQLSARRDLAAARRFFIRALRAGTIPAEVTTDRAPAYPRVLDELIPSALHTVERYANNSVETDHGRLKARLRPMRGLKRHRSARTLAAGHAFVQNLRRGHYELATDAPARHRIRTAFDQLTTAI